MVDFEELKKKYPRGMIIFRGMMIIVISTIFSLIIISPIYLFDIDKQTLRDFFTYPVDLIPYPYNCIGLLMFPIGFVLVIWANYALLQIGKIGLRSREPMQTPSNLVVVGPYKYSRNPIYLGVLLLLLGLVIILSSLVFFLFLIAIYIIFKYLFIRKEEIILENAFGDEYRNFKKQVRRWF